MKSLVYDGTPIESQEELVGRIVAAAGEIRDKPEIVGNAVASIVKRCRLCIDVNGQIFENLK